MPGIPDQDRAERRQPDCQGQIGAGLEQSPTLPGVEQQEHRDGHGDENRVVLAEHRPAPGQSGFHPVSRAATVPVVNREAEPVQASSQKKSRGPSGRANIDAARP